VNKILSVIFTIFVVLSTINLNATIILDDTPEMHMMYDAVEYEDKILIIGTALRQKGDKQFFSYLKISALSNDKLTDFNNLYNSNDTIKVYWPPKIIKDSENNLWLNGNGLFKYSNNKWNKFEIVDEHKDLRSYANITFDKNGALWGTATVYSKDYYESLIFKFENNEFTILDKVDVYLKHNKLVTVDDKIYVFNYYSLYNKPYKLDTIYDITEYDIHTNKKIKEYRIPSYEDPELKDVYFSKDYNFVNVINDSIIFILKTSSQFGDIETQQSGYCCDETVLLTNGKFEFLRDKIKYDKNFDVRGLFVSKFKDKILFNSLNNYQNYIIENDFSIREFTNENIIKNSKIIKIRKAISNDIILDVKNSRLMPVKILDFKGQLIIVMNSMLNIYDNSIPLSLEEYNINKEKIIIYPNPVINSISLLNISNVSDISDLSLFDINGIKIKDFNKNEIQDNLLQLNSLTNGSYFLKINFQSNNSKILQFKKNN
jgi:hypothetical protein